MKTPERIQNAIIGAMLATILAPALLITINEGLPAFFPFNPLGAAFLLMTCAVLVGAAKSCWEWVEEALGHETSILPVLYIIGTIGAMGSGAPFNAWEVFTGLLFCIAAGSLWLRFLKFMKHHSTLDEHALEKKKNEAQQPLEIPTRLILESTEKYMNPWNIVDLLRGKEEQETS